MKQPGFAGGIADRPHAAVARIGLDPEHFIKTVLPFLHQPAAIAGGNAFDNAVPPGASEKEALAPLIPGDSFRQQIGRVDRERDSAVRHRRRVFANPAQEQFEFVRAPQLPEDLIVRRVEANVQIERLIERRQRFAILSGARPRPGQRIGDRAFVAGRFEQALQPLHLGLQQFRIVRRNRLRSGDLAKESAWNCKEKDFPASVIHLLRIVNWDTRR